MALMTLVIVQPAALVLESLQPYLIFLSAAYVEETEGNRRIERSLD